MDEQATHPLTDEQIAEFWPDMATPEGRANIRRQFNTLMEHLARSKPRGFPRHPELMASIVAEKAQLLPERVEALRHGLAGLPEHWAKYQWRADDRDLFGERYVRFYGDDGHGMGRQAIMAVCSGFKSYFGALAHFIAAANPDTIRMLLAEREALQRERKDAAEALETAQEILGWYERTVANCRKASSEGDKARAALDRDGGGRAKDGITTIITLARSASSQGDSSNG